MKFLWMVSVVAAGCLVLSVDAFVVRGPALLLGVPRRRSRRLGLSEGDSLANGPPPTPDRAAGYYEGLSHTLPDFSTLAYDELYVPSNEEDLVLFLNNLSDVRQNDKSRSVLEYCRSSNRNFMSFDWFSRGDSDGNLMAATLTRWRDDAIDFLDLKGEGVLRGSSRGRGAVLVGAGIGGWVSLLVALARPDLVRGIVGLSADPDFTEDLLWAQLPEEEKEEIMQRGVLEIKWGGRRKVYPITSSLIVDARQHLLLRGGKESLEIYCPVRLIHALEDEEVPFTVPLRLAEVLASSNVRIVMPKRGGHDLKEDFSSSSSTAKGQRRYTIQAALHDCLDQCFSAAADAAAATQNNGGGGGGGASLA